MVLLLEGNANVRNAPLFLYSLGLDAYISVALLNTFKRNNITKGSAFNPTSKSTHESRRNQFTASLGILSLYRFQYRVYQDGIYERMEPAHCSTRECITKHESGETAAECVKLSLPWVYAMTLAAASSMLQWLISQPPFVTWTEIFNVNSELEQSSYVKVPYSPLVIFIALLVGIGMVLAKILNGFWKLKLCVLMRVIAMRLHAVIHEASLIPRISRRYRTPGNPLQISKVSSRLCLTYVLEARYQEVYFTRAKSLSFRHNAHER